MSAGVTPAARLPEEPGGDLARANEIEAARRRANRELLRFRLIEFLYVPLAVVGSLLAALGIFRLPHPIGLVLGLALLPMILLAISLLRDPTIGVYLLFVLDIYRPQDQFPVLRHLKPALLTFAVVGVVFVLRFFSQTERKLVWTPHGTAFVAFIALIGCSVFTTPYNRFFSYQIFWGMLTVFLTYFLTMNLVRTPKKFAILVRLVLICYALLTVKGLWNYLRMGEMAFALTASSFLADENDFALALVVILPFALYGFTIWRSRVARAMALALLFLLLSGIGLTLSRGGMVGCAATLLFCWWRGRRKIVLMLGFAAALSLTALVVPSRFWSEMRSIGETNQGTARGRKEFWKAGMRIYRDNPVIGVGAGNSGVVLPQYFFGPNAGTKWGRALHGTFPQLASELGTIGIAVYFWLVGAVWLGLDRAKRVRLEPGAARERDFLVYSIQGSLVGFFVTATFLSALYYPHFYTLLALASLTTVFYGSPSAAGGAGSGVAPPPGVAGSRA